MARWVGLSLIAHIVIMAGLLTAAGTPLQKPKVITIDVSIVSPADACKTPNASSGASGAARSVPVPLSSRSRSESVIPAGPAPRTALQSNGSEKVATQPQTVTPSGHPAPSPIIGSPNVASAHHDRRFEGGASAGASPASGTATVVESKNITSAQQRYRAQYFGFIRDQISRHLVYPQLARRRGWSGRVVLSFVVTEEGAVRSVLIKEGSGHSILDSCAVETVKNAAPFPRPPVAAEITVPLVFQLE